MRLRTARFASPAMFAVLMILVPGTGCSGPGADAVRDGERLDQRHDDFAAALAAADAGRIAELYAEDAVIHVADRDPIEGREAILPFYETLFGFLSASSLTPETTRISDAGDMAFSVGSTSNEFRGPDGTMAYSGKYMLVWTRKGDDWLISAYAISGNATPEE